MNAQPLTRAWNALLPIRLPALAERALQRWLGFTELAELQTRLESGASVTGALLRHLQVRHHLPERDLAQIPKSGATILVANHPYGVLEGALLASIVGRVRSDVKILANPILAGLHGEVIAVEPEDSSAARRGNAPGLRAALAHLAAGGLLIVFPAAEVSRFVWRRRGVEDGAWKPGVARLLRMLRRRDIDARVVPALVEGRNSLLFHAVGMLHPGIRLALLARELVNKRKALVKLRFGHAVAASQLEAMASDEERMAYLRWRTYRLAQPSESPRMSEAPLAPVAGAVPPEDLRADVMTLEPLVTAGALRVFCASAAEIPHVLPEIARLREVTFRAVGEGTGRALDRDAFDETYWHLFVWNEETAEVVGAYRLAATDRTPELYTRTLFRYGPELLAKLGPSLELGRSFVRVEYQRSFQALLLLWQGIGEFIGRHPRYRVLFGPVSISNAYQAASRELMVAYLERHAWWDELARLVTCRNPFRRDLELPAAVRDFDDLSSLLADVEPDAQGVPVLLRQYLKLGGRLLGFNVDPEFSRALDGLIVVDLLATEPRLLQRYLGKDAAARFVAYQKGTNAWNPPAPSPSPAGRCA